MDRPAPPHSDALNRMVGATPDPDPLPEPHAIPAGDVIDPAVYEQRRITLRRQAAARSRARRMRAA